MLGRNRRLLPGQKARKRLPEQFFSAVACLVRRAEQDQRCPD